MDSGEDMYQHANTGKTGYNGANDKVKKEKIVCYKWEYQQIDKGITWYYYYMGNKNV